MSTSYETTSSVSHRFDAKQLVEQLLETQASEAEKNIVYRQLGRFPRGMVAVGARCVCGRPLAVITRPCLEDGTPFPTTCYLTSPESVKAVSRLEAQGIMREFNERLQSDESFAEHYMQAHQTYLRFRHVLAERLGDSEEHIASMSAGGMPTRVKCLHAIVAQTLVMGAHINPVGDEVLAAIRDEFAPDVCRCTIPWTANDDEDDLSREQTTQVQQVNQDHAVRVAAIDCGTNSIRLKIAQVSKTGMVDIVPRLLRVVRLGQDIDSTHRFSDEALQRVRQAAQEFAEVLRKNPVDAIRFVATSATRDASNRTVFEDMMREILGVEPEVISGIEEARLSFLGATSVVSRSSLQAPYLVVDLGGGSTELVLGGDGQSSDTDTVVAAYSMDIGSVRMTERHLHTDPPTQAEIAEAIEDIDAHIDEALQHVPVGRARTIIGVSGTVTTMAALALGLKRYDHHAVDGVPIAIDQAYTVNDRFLHMPRSVRRNYNTIHPGRIDVVGGGAVVLSRILERVSKAVYEDHGGVLETFVASEHGLLDGITLDLGRRTLEANPYNTRSVL